MAREEGGRIGKWDNSFFLLSTLVVISSSFLVCLYVICVPRGGGIATIANEIILPMIMLTFGIIADLGTQVKRGELRTS
jgi:hypothetical protein